MLHGKRRRPTMRLRCSTGAVFLLLSAAMLEAPYYTETGTNVQSMEILDRLRYSECFWCGDTPLTPGLIPINLERRRAPPLLLRAKSIWSAGGLRRSCCEPNTGSAPYVFQ